MFGRSTSAKKAAKAAKAAKKKADSVLDDAGTAIGKMTKRAKKESASAAKVVKKEAVKTAKVTRKEAVRTAKVTKKEAVRTAKVAKKEAAVTAKSNKQAAKAAKKNGARAAKANDKVAKAESTLMQADAKAVKTATKTAKQAAKADAKAAKVRAKQPAGLLGQLTNPKTASRAMSVAKIVGPSVAPYALRAATSARGYIDERRAQKLGVSADEIAAYRGPTGPVGARIASLRSGIADLRRRRATDSQVNRFSEVATARLADLEIAAHTAASMPSARRRGTLAALNRELNQIEADLMTYLVGSAR